MLWGPTTKLYGMVYNTGASVSRMIVLHSSASSSVISTSASIQSIARKIVGKSSAGAQAVRCMAQWRQIIETRIAD